MVRIGKVKKTKLHVTEPSILEIVGKDEKKVFEIDKDGKVFWLKGGKFVQAKMDTDLSLAFMVAITTRLGYLKPGMSYKSVIEKLKTGERI